MGPDPLLAGLEEIGDLLPGRAGVRAAGELSTRYRAERGADGRLLSEAEVVAYAVSRMPATYAAARSALAALAVARPEFAPASVLDLGGGLGAAAFAAAATWETIVTVTVVDASGLMIGAGQRLLAAVGDRAPAPRFEWQSGDLAQPAHARPSRSADLVTLSYVLSELPEVTRRHAIDAAGGAAGGAVVAIEPGTPAGYQRILDARADVIRLGFEVAAPCPHSSDCPISGGRDWCHFATRLTRSRAHRAAKQGQLGYEDEKFSYIAATKLDGAAAATPSSRGRIIRHPTWRKSLVELRVCEPGEPRVEVVRVARSAGDLYRTARGSTWGDAWPP